MACDTELKEYKKCRGGSSYSECRKDYRKYSSCMKKLGLEPVLETKPSTGTGGTHVTTKCRVIGVRTYTRVRLGKEEQVREHSRRTCTKKEAEEFKQSLKDKQ